ncbi:pyruvate dehydrogenase complex transcriptional repressor PdhR [Aestuariibacter salexigens]|uniref:pyruvate dehydrogenase complex transcriptional repressor PdhR n=1 Tax=Aestuariibacter salexigens TaxID=226010 RepID=UPI00041A4690|nr:pyruvate dehydrogenase complex transcriptional repressor PdhR [Aestuariibacter salexigens]
MKQVRAKKLSDVISEQLESMILDGTFLAGQRLPPERELAERFEVSRPSIRDAIQILQAKGLLVRKQGGGTFVNRELNATMTDPLLMLVAKRPETQFDLLEFRHALEGMAAYYAALRGQPEDYQALEQALNALPCDDDCEAEAKALAEFYLVMANASHNMVLMHVMRTMKGMLQDNIQRNLQMLKHSADVSADIRAQRRQIVSAIMQRDPDGARTASNAHLAFIEKTLLNINRRDSRVQRALRRIEIKPA